jgi:thiamine pyrophosphate-dependent acetolactate synthase large subunit-like protein
MTHPISHAPAKYTPMDRREAVPALIGDPSDFLIVSGLAGAAKDVGFHTKETPNTFLLGGAMGAASMIALGLALAQPEKRVLLVTGDGELLMSLGSLATIGALQPKNLSIIIIDNELYGETGDQATHTKYGVDLKAVAEGCGIANTRFITAKEEIAPASKFLRQSNGTCFVLMKVAGGLPANYNRNWHCEETKLAFRKALLGTR